MTRERRSTDAWGLLLSDYAAGINCIEVIERDDGFVAATENVPVYFSCYDAWPGHVKEAMQFVQGRVLDVGVGAGRFALYLQEQGHESLASTFLRGPWRCAVNAACTTFDNCPSTVWTTRWVFSTPSL